jgi:DNA processing protein
LYVRGVLPKGGIAVIGSRTPPPEATEFAYAFASRMNQPVIAGLAPGIDVAAHRGALAAGIRTVAFVGYGFGRTDPPEHQELERDIVAAGGAIATLLPPGTPATEATRIERDRLQAEHAQAVVLVCTEVSGGALYTMRFARELGVARFAITPPTVSSSPFDKLRVTQDVWAGNVACIADGAMPLPFDVDRACDALRRSLS